MILAFLLAASLQTDSWNPAAADALHGRWCDAIISSQNVRTDDPALRGALDCPACGLLHGRIADIVWPMSWRYVRTGDVRYLDAANRAVEWSERNMLRAGGFYVNDQQSKWIYTTVFSQIAFGKTLLRLGDRLPSAAVVRWDSIFRRQSEFLIRHFAEPGNRPNVNYLAAFCEAMALAGKVTGESRFDEAGRRMSQRVLALFTPDGFLIGENNPVEAVSADRHLPFIDIAYNLEESLPALSAAAEMGNDAALSAAVLKSARAHAAFMLPDGGMDAATGSRAIKWTYYGSRTSDGALPLWAWCAKRGEPWATRMIARTLGLLERCTSARGLLCGGPDYVAAGEPPCIHHTFTHVKALTDLLADPPPDSAAACPLPRESAKGVSHIASMDVDLVSVGPWRATFSANDAPKGGGRRLALGGGSLALLWHERLGPVAVGTPASFHYVEGHNMQDQRHDFVERCMTPRLEVRTGDGAYSNLPDYGVRIRSRMEGESFVYEAQGTLTAANDERLLTNGTYRIEWLLEPDGLRIRAESSVPAEFVLPVVARAAEDVRIESDGPLETVRTDRGKTAFSTVGGFLYRYYALPAATAHTIHMTRRENMK